MILPPVLNFHHPKLPQSSSIEAVKVKPAFALFPIWISSLAFGHLGSHILFLWFELKLRFAPFHAGQTTS